jgi:hypothetical protein
MRADFEKSEEIRLKQADMRAKFQARGQELESQANAGKKERTVSDDQQKLFIDLLKNYPKTQIKIFVNSNDEEAINYARKIRGLLAAAKYGEETDGIIKSSSAILTGTNQVPWQPTSNALAFMVVPNPKYGLFIPVGTPFNDIKPVISSGLTNDPAMYALGKLECVKWAFSGIGVSGIYIPDTNVLKPGEVGIIVPPKPK